MTLPSSGSLSMSQINGEFGRGNDLNSYRGTLWYTDANASGNFSSGTITFNDFFGKRLTAPWVVTTLTGSGTYTVPSGKTALWVLLVAGGGGGGSGLRDGGGGGGAGGVLNPTISVSGGQTFNYSVGAGGAGNTGTNGQGGQGVTGSNTTFGSYTAHGGGGGGGTYVNTYFIGGYDKYGNPLTATEYIQHNGLPGGSGGGANAYYGQGLAGAGTSGEGNNGGAQNDNGYNGGGGGAGSVGYSTYLGYGYSGGLGVTKTCTVNGYTTYSNTVGGGGGAGAGFNGDGNTSRYAASGGYGGGAGGAWANNSSGTSGSAGTSQKGGGGGGGCGIWYPPYNYPGGNGGSGIIVVVAY